MYAFIKALFIVGLFFLSKATIEYLIFTNLDIATVKSELRVQLIQVVEYIVFLITIFFISKKSENTIRHELRTYKPQIIVFIIFVLTVALRVFNDPIFRINEILGKVHIPNLSKEYDYFTLSSCLLLLRVGILSPIIEEVIFRQLVLKEFSESRKLLIAGIFFSSFLFALVHVKLITIIASFFLGILAALIYLSYGLFYSILFHCFYNLVWFILLVYQNYYWSLIKALNFGISYWLVVSLCLVILAVFVIRQMRIINKKFVSLRSDQIFRK